MAFHHLHFANHFPFSGDILFWVMVCSVVLFVLSRRNSRRRARRVPPAAMFSETDIGIAGMERRVANLEEILSTPGRPSSASRPPAY